jgi:DNA-binding NtrC family response regulator
MSQPMSRTSVRADDSAAYNTTHVAWVDDVALTRDVMSQALLNTDSSFEITQFETVDDCIHHSNKNFDTVLYHSHESHFRRFADVAILSDAYPDARIVLLSDSITLDTRAFGQALASGASTYLLSRVTSLKTFARTLLSDGGREKTS